MSGINDGHVIIKHGDSMQRAIRDATVATIEHDRAVMAPRAMPRFDKEEGLYDTPALNKERKLPPREIRAIAESFNMLGVYAKTAIGDDKAIVTLAKYNGWSWQKKTCEFSALYPPTELQVRTLLHMTAKRVQAS